jgi:hypothetical protein
MGLRLSSLILGRAEMGDIGKSRDFEYVSERYRYRFFFHYDESGLNSAPDVLRIRVEVSLLITGYFIGGYDEPYESICYWFKDDAIGNDDLPGLIKYCDSLLRLKGFW